MKPIGILMIEHRLIEKFLSLVRQEIDRIEERLAADPHFLKTTVDFIRTYADKIHHGKEEDILFERLKHKTMDAHDTAVMAELDAEHVVSRGVVAELVQAEAGFLGGDRAQIEVIKEKLNFICDFYPVHIAKEDKDFFPKTQRYFTAEELDRMLADFDQFDSGMDKEHYNKLYDRMWGELHS
ncbi:MAG: cation-binding protein [Clostridiales bacterium]|nr:cation-binding protein [Clostridiales bacterium]